MKYRRQSASLQEWEEYCEMVLPPNTVTYDFVSVPAGRTHEVFVAAVNRKGTSAASNTVSVNLPARLPPLMMQPPFKLTSTHSTLTVGWVSPHLRGLECTGFLLQRFNESGELEASTEVEPTERRLVVDSLETDTSYGFAISACCELGQGDWSDVAKMRTSLDLSIPYNEIIRILSGMKTLMLDARTQFRGCAALAEIAGQCRPNALAVAKLGGFSAVLRAMWAYPNSADVQERGCGVLVVLGQYANEIEVVMESGSQHLLADMQTRPWNCAMRAQAMRLINIVHERTLGSEAEASGTSAQESSPYYQLP
eukprot:TRINITY_DN29001_c0_g1_i3.p1 TRINITY_DN29001_c0_g1~~TRINITY_DN29001_c0_g1_i3.p1  ORF type:complete len:310 (+),score=53.02 TRINITY_DN29001_c0_g1_i3:353-1282(+)